MDIPPLFFERHPNPMFIFDDDTLQFIDVNEKAVKKYGYSKEEFSQLTIEDIRPPEDIPRLRGHLQKLEGKNFHEDAIFRHRTKDGRMLYVQVTSQRFSSSREDNSRIAHIHDITETIRLKQEIEQAYKEQQQLINYNPLAMVKCDRKFRITEWSRRAEVKTGYSREEILGTSVFNLDLVDDKTGRIKERFLKLASGKTDQDRFDTAITVKEGDLMDIQLHVSALRDQEGELKSILAFIENITEHKENSRQMEQRESKYHTMYKEAQKAREELRRREELFESLFVDSPIAIAMINTDGKVQKLNKSFEELFGYTEEELVGKDLLKHQLPEKRYDEIKQRYMNALANGKGADYYTDERLTKKGEVKELLIGALPVVVEGECIAVFGIYTDITQLKETEQRLQSSLKEKEVLLAEIHHRVKNNLAIISGLLELESMNWGEDTEVRKVLRQSQLRIYSMASIHEQLYKFKDFATLSLEDYICKLVDSIFTSMKGREMGITPVVESDNISLNINQAIPCALIINELVTNALKYAYEEQPQGVLKVIAKQDEEEITLVIEDDGLGLPEDFHQMVHHSLGHQLVNQLVKQLNGNIDVQTAADKGTQYQIIFRKAEKAGSASSHFR